MAAGSSSCALPRPRKSGTPRLVDRVTYSLTLDGLQTLVIAPDSSWLATTSYDTTVRIWDAASGELRHTLTGHRKQVEAILIAPDSSWLVTASGDTTVRIWTAKGFGHGLPVVENRVPVNDMAVSPGTGAGSLPPIPLRRWYRFGTPQRVGYVIDSPARADLCRQ